MHDPTSSPDKRSIHGPSTSGKASTSIVLIAILLYVAFPGAWSADRDGADIPSLIADLGAGDVSQRLDAQNALEEIGERAVPALADALASENPELRYGAVETLRAIGPDAEAALPALLTALQDDRLRLSAAKALEAAGPAALPYLADALADPDQEVRSRAVFTIGAIAGESGEAGEAVPALVDLLRDPTSAGEPDGPADKQTDALTALSESQAFETGGMAKALETMAAANEMIKNGAAQGSEQERQVLRQALDQARQQMMAGRPAFQEALDTSSPRPSLRPNIALTLGDIGAPAVAELVTLLQDEDAAFRRLSTVALKQMGNNAADELDDDEPLNVDDDITPGLSALTVALGDEDAKVQAGAVDALAAFREASVPPLTDALEDAEASRRAHAAKALGKIGPPAEDAIPALTAALDDADADVRENAAGAIGNIGDDSAYSTARLNEILLEDDSPEVRRAAADALARLGDAASLPALVEAFGDEDEMVRRSAGRSLLAHGEASIPLLVQALGDDNERLRAHAQRYLLHVGRQMPQWVTGPLEQALQDDRDAIRTQAQKLLSLIEQQQPDRN